ncbi:MAG: hypothetical protein N0C88_11670 [Candidatus Thiodiazotropha lotti]|uniref:Uncharacterized protein n=1 Tax=Candidatus Thiodiazotropha lotti TaxID=2792787 RepID=A0A9E4K5Z6_9GAMM|nr:hypothetical protein [Candidatus Thiodiazotropha lotti]MCW4203961.1 hypothetical protein [Candidatus Thiodiazotropha lotti]
MRYTLRVLILFFIYNTAFSSTCLRIEPTNKVPGWFFVYNSCGASLSGDYSCTPSGKSGQFSVSKCERTQLHCKAEDGLSLESVYVVHGNPHSFCLTDKLNDESIDSISGSQTMKNINSNLERKYKSSLFTNNNTNSINNDSAFNSIEIDRYREMIEEFEDREQKLLDDMHSEIEEEKRNRNRNRNFNKQNLEAFGSFFGGILQGLLIGNSMHNHSNSGVSTRTPNFLINPPPSIPSAEETVPDEKRCQATFWSGDYTAYKCSDGSSYSTGTQPDLW